MGHGPGAHGPWRTSHGARALTGPVLSIPEEAQPSVSSPRFHWPHPVFLQIPGKVILDATSLAIGSESILKLICQSG